jgi:hypothetical protein
MSECVVDTATAQKLLASSGEVLVKDESGRVLGRFVSAELAAGYREATDIGLTPEELARRLAPDAKTYTTAEVLAYLRSR